VSPNSGAFRPIPLKLLAVCTYHRAGWLVGTAVAVTRVTSLAGRIDSTSVSVAEKTRTDLLNAEVCASVGKQWPGL
jgi:hypothetical protein